MHDQDILRNVSLEKLSRFNTILKTFISELHANRSITLLNKIDDSYYMQKSEEIRMLMEELRAREEKVDATKKILNEIYTDIFCSWQEDARWLNLHLKKVKAT